MSPRVARNSWAQVIRLPLPPRVLGLQARDREPGLGTLYSKHFTLIIVFNPNNAPFYR